MNNPKVSVIIPVRNGAGTLDKCLKSLCAQTIGDCIEIIVLDSMSTDGSREIAESYGATIINVPMGEFDHGLTRNKGVLATSGEFVFLTVQDATMGRIDLLERMANHFIDLKVMGVVGHQAVPHEKDTNPMQWFRPISEPSITEKKIDTISIFKALPQKQQQALIAWDDVVAMYRKTALLQQPFVQTAFAEDWIWSFNALQKGWKLLHDSSLVVYHYHHHTYQYAFTSRYTINYHFYKFFKYKPAVPSLAKPIMRAAYHLLKNKELSLKEKAYWINHNVVGVLANYFSTKDFLKRLRKDGETGIEKGYLIYCMEIPQGIQKKR
jgi:rhamnosyltransferase